jgi:hypothetical protein
MSALKESELYNGWKNRATWDVAMIIWQDESLYYAAIHYRDMVQRRGGRPTYKGYVAYMNLYVKKTVNGYRFDSAKLDYRALSEMIQEL